MDIKIDTNMNIDASKSQEATNMDIKIDTNMNIDASKSQEVWISSCQTQVVFGSKRLLEATNHSGKALAKGLGFKVVVWSYLESLGYSGFYRCWTVGCSLFRLLGAC